MEAIYENRNFRIEEFSPEYGFYIFVYENGECICDYVQDTVEICQEFALEEFNVPIESWKISEKETKLTEDS